MPIHPNRVFSCQEIRALDKQAIENIGIPGMVLMENAGLAVAQFLEAYLENEKVVICCGKGNNAGDGLVVARHLWNHGFDVEVLLFELPEYFSQDTLTNYQIAKNCQVPMHQVKEGMLKNVLFAADWIVDALFGTGLQGGLQRPYHEIVSAINQMDAKVLSIDVPSGLNADTGQADGACVKADITLSFVGLKQGFLNPQAQRYLGELHVIDIGIPKVLLETLT
jgi:NAD(P)H-hydrate epimerase